MSTTHLGSLAAALSIFLAGCAASPTPPFVPVGEAATAAPPTRAGSVEPEPAAVCPDIEPHPIAVSIADDFDAPYEDVVEWFCGGHTFEDILLALQTDKLAPVGAEVLLAERRQGKTWSAIWAERGITAP